MKRCCRTILSAAVLIVAGCPMMGPGGGPNGHYRPHGHINMTFDVSPSDETIVFNATGKGARDLYLLELEDRSVVRITNSDDYEVSPACSADGKSIVYAAGIRGDKADHIFTIGIDGKGRRQLTKGPSHDSTPRFSPDGSMIVFARDKTYQWGGLAANWEDAGVICVVNSDGTNERQITSEELVAHTPQFSADGQSVIYGTATGTFIAPLDGSAPPKNLSAISRRIDMTVDGKKIAYTGGKYSGDQEILCADLDGTNAARVTDSVADRHRGCIFPVFTSTGKTIYFLMDAWPNGPTGVPKKELWRINVDGTELKQITDLALFDHPMEWKPSPDMVE